MNDGIGGSLACGVLGSIPAAFLPIGYRVLCRGEIAAVDLYTERYTAGIGFGVSGGELEGKGLHPSTMSLWSLSASFGRETYTMGRPDADWALVTNRRRYIGYANVKVTPEQADLADGEKTFHGVEVSREGGVGLAYQVALQHFVGLTVGAHTTTRVLKMSDRERQQYHHNPATLEILGMLNYIYLPDGRTRPHPHVDSWEASFAKVLDGVLDIPELTLRHHAQFEPAGLASQFLTDVYAGELPPAAPKVRDSAFLLGLSVALSGNAETLTNYFRATSNWRGVMVAEQLAKIAIYMGVAAQKTCEVINDTTGECTKEVAYGRGDESLLGPALASFRNLLGMLAISMEWDPKIQYAIGQGLSVLALGIAAAVDDPATSGAFFLAHAQIQAELRGNPNPTGEASLSGRVRARLGLGGHYQNDDTSGSRGRLELVTDLNIFDHANFGMELLMAIESAQQSVDNIHARTWNNTLPNVAIPVTVQLGVGVYAQFGWFRFSVGAHSAAQVVGTDTRGGVGIHGGAYVAYHFDRPWLGFVHDLEAGASLSYSHIWANGTHPSDDEFSVIPTVGASF